MTTLIELLSYLDAQYEQVADTIRKEIREGELT